MLEYQSTEQFIILALTITFPPIAFLVFLVLVLATFGKSLGIRKAYVRILLRTFEWATKRIEKRNIYVNGDVDYSSDEECALVNGLNRSSSSKSLIAKDEKVIMKRILSDDDVSKRRASPALFADSLDFVKEGIESIIEDEVTLRFSAEELTSWNLLTRTSYGYHFVSLRLTVVWCFGFVFRYFVLLPFRLIILCLGLIFLVVCTAFVGYVPEGNTKRWLNRHVSLMCYRVLSRALSVIATFHNQENAAKCFGICVANHTSPIDVLILAQDNCYALVGQKHVGLLGLVQRSLSRASAHIWFERSEANDRLAVSKRLKDHTDNPNNLPILIFPEGTCINNTSVMMFKKGSFEIGATVYPVAIKYDPRFGDAFWNSTEQTYMQYVMMMMTSWAIVVDVWYLPPMQIEEHETSINFANRVKKAVAAAGGLVELDWDGQLKRYPVKKELLLKQQEKYSKKFQAMCNGYINGDGNHCGIRAYQG